MLSHSSVESVENAGSRTGATARALEILTGGSAIAVVGLALMLAAGALALTPLGPRAVPSGIVASFIGAVFGGLCAFLISRTPGNVSSPLNSLAVIYAALCGDLIASGGSGIQLMDIFATLSLTVVLMGVLQILAGVLRISDAMKFLPYPVTAGFVTGIGLLIVWAQVGPLLGLEGRLANYRWSELTAHFKPFTVAVGALTAATVWIVPNVTKRVQPLLAALLLGTLAYHLAAQFTGNDTLGPTLGTIEVFSLAQSNFGAIWKPVTPAWVIQTGVHVFPYALFLALQAIISAALTSVAVTDITGQRANVNRMLIAQGVGNMLSGSIGGLPIGSSPPQSVAAARMSNINRIVPGASIMILLVVIAVLGRFLNYVPIAVLAGILVTSGIGLIDRWARTLARHALRRDMRADIKWNLCIVIAVAATFFFGSVPLALMVGAVLAMILLTINLSAATKLAAQDGTGFSSTRVWPPAHTAWLSEARSTIRVVRPRGGLFFGTADQLADVLERLDRKVRFCIIDFSQLTTVDATGCQMITASAKKLAARGVKLSLAGLNPAEPRDNGLVHLGLTLPEPDSWYPDLDHALEAIETELLREHCGETITDAPVPLGDTTIANGLSDSELQIFREHLRSVQCDAGSVVCKTGEPGSSLYIVTAGEVEIRTSHEISDGGRRLAIFGPGCMFGEVALFTGGLRTADAVCTKRTTLHELTQEALRLIAQSFPPLHGKILANLNANLATRLVVATEIVRGQR